MAGLVSLIAGCGGGDGGGGVGSGDSLTLLDVQAQVFAPSCGLAGCHSGAGSPFGLDLSSATASSASLTGTASAEVPGLLRIEPFNATDSYLYMKLINDPRIQGDPMPLNRGVLSTADLNLVASWINEGAN